jgi:hypothetical protein
MRWRNLILTYFRLCPRRTSTRQLASRVINYSTPSVRIRWSTSLKWTRSMVPNPYVKFWHSDAMSKLRIGVGLNADADAPAIIGIVQRMLHATALSSFNDGVRRYEDSHRPGTLHSIQRVSVGCYCRCANYTWEAAAADAVLEPQPRSLWPSEVSRRWSKCRLPCASTYQTFSSSCLP